jgi:Hypoxia induced protein conserved region
MVVGFIVLAALILATVVVLVTGIVLMARGGEANVKYGNKLMVARVTLQGAALAVAVLLLMMKN